MEPATVIAYILIILGIILLIAEAFTPGVFMVIPGTVFVILGVLGLFNADFLLSWYAVLVAVLVAAPVTILTIYVYRLLGKPEPPTTTVAESLLGSTGIVTVTTVPGTLKGKVKIGSDTWSARSDVPIEAGTKVRVVKSEGVHVFVEPEE
ncbi:MAG: NfeD family protein [Candidatus Methanomethylophilaceae archaeon]|jgi:membrane protein implicated in regulation of membrane protease activity